MARPCDEAMGIMRSAKILSQVGRTLDEHCKTCEQCSKWKDELWDWLEKADERMNTLKEKLKEEKP